MLAAVELPAFVFGGYIPRLAGNNTKAYTMTNIVRGLSEVSDATQRLQCSSVLGSILKSPRGK